jgi:aspartokinase/homoserine dehydrogenase 1
MRVLKFGGTSVGDARRIRAVGTIVERAARSERVGVVVSAVAGVTNQLVQSIADALDGEPAEPRVQRFRDIHAAILQELGEHASAELCGRAAAEIAGLGDEYSNLLRGVGLLRECPPSVADLLGSLGERASVCIVHALLASAGLQVLRADPRDHVVTTPQHGNALPLYAETARRFEPVRRATWQVCLMAGFYGATAAGKITTLGRGGSDFSASILAFALEADALEIWTDVDGVYSSDPAVVPEAFLLPEMTYEEAMELAFFGAKVLHPRTLGPLLARRIPTTIKNTFRPEAPGTLIHQRAAESSWVIRGISSLSGMVMLCISGGGMRGALGVAARVFQTMSREGISVVLISQASSEYSISFCVGCEAGARAVAALEQEFELERAAGQVDAIELLEELAILSIVGDDMRRRRGIAGTFFGALAAADVNVVAIAQGSSERNISVVVQAADRARGIRAAHQFFFNSRQQIQLFLVGVGGVGSQLLSQLAEQHAKLFDQQVDVRLCAVANSRGMVVDLGGLDITTAKDRLARTTLPFRLEDLLREVEAARPINPVLVDCTSSRDIADAYPRIFEAGLHVVTANKKANSLDQRFYATLRRAANARKRKFLYETNVGAGLPIVSTLRDLINSGDRLLELQGVLSGSMSFLFGLLEEGVPFSAAVRTAQEKGFTEPDPRDDLGGIDVARKLLILAREVGERLELDEVVVEPVLPPDFDQRGSVTELVARLDRLDAHFAAWLERLRPSSKVLRFVGSVRGRSCRVAIVEVGPEHPLYHVRNGENAVSFLTERYRPIPLVVRGYGAGPAVTAAGVFANVLQTVYWNAGS